MGKVIAIANQKGGVGKTTTSINLAASLSHLGRRVMLIDLDAQGNATMGSGIDKSAITLTLADVFLEEATLQEVITQTPAGYDLVPGNSDLTAAEVGLMSATRKEHRLLQQLARVRDSYDYLLIDCPPALNVLTLNALVASDSVLIPMQCEYYALEGLTGLVNTIEQVRESVNPKLTLEGLVRTMYDPRNRLTGEVSSQLEEHFGEKLYQATIPRNVRLAEAPSYGLPALLYDAASSGARAYIQLAEEMLSRREQEFPAEALAEEVEA